MAEKKRILKNWMQAYREWTLPRSEAPESMVVWAGLFTIAATMKRKVIFPQSMLGSYEIYPNLFMLFVGKPGVVRKSTTAGYAEELLLTVSTQLQSEVISIAPTAASSSKFIDLITKSPDASVTIISSEFSSFIGPSKEAMYELLTDIFDGKKKFDYATRSHGVELSEKPVVNLLAATTPAWVSRQPPEHFLGGGFASRVLFIFESKRRQYKLYYDDVDYKRLDIIGKMLVNDLACIADLKGEFKHDSRDTRDWMEAWYKQHAQNAANDDRMAGYYERKHVHAHKVAMILSAAERDDLIVTKDHFLQAIALLDELEIKMPRAIATIGSNPIGQHLYDLLDFIRDREQATKKQVMARFVRDLRSEELSELLSALDVMGEIEIVPNGRNPTYKSKKQLISSPSSS